jgi:ADP-L-glycero-D-manno-heptose 6-epimerase
VDKKDFYPRFGRQEFGQVEAVFHEGACSDTMEHNGQYMMENNYHMSRELLLACQAQGTRLLYASSAATYGASSTFSETPENEHPLNVYGYSKLLFDQIVRNHCGPDWTRQNKQVAGFRYFNVYGPNEQHKARMASVAFHQHFQFLESGVVKLFGPYGGYASGEQMRDFIWIKDLVAVKLWFFDHPEKSGIFNLGSGQAQPFNDVALSVVNAHRRQLSKIALTLQAAVEEGLIQYMDFPASLVGKYQCFTQADLTRLRQIGCTHEFQSVEQGVSAYIDHLILSQAQVN